MASVGNEITKKNKRVALGIERHLDRFASVHGARTWKQIARHDPDNWKHFFLQIMNDPDSEVYFNLEDVDVWRGITRAASGSSGYYTDWELLEIKTHPNWWSRVSWWMGEGGPVDNPFASEEHDDVSI